VPRTSDPGPVLSLRRLNRATLARQLLLDPADAPAPPRRSTPRGLASVLERIGGLQAQEPASPFIALWTRLPDFDPGDLARALDARAVVKGTLMRSTVHLASAADYRSLAPLLLAGVGPARRTDRRRPPDPSRFATLRRRIARYAAQPRNLGELRSHVGDLDGMTADEVVWWLRRSVPFVHAPADVAWSFGRRPALVHVDAWLGSTPGEADPHEAAADEAAAGEVSATERLVRRHLGAFGPATIADVAQWSGLPVARLRPGVDALDAAGALRRFRDERGQALIDLVDAPLPAEEVPAPPRLLPMWDSTILAFADRARHMADDDRPAVVARNGDTLATFTVDGRIAGRWWAVHEQDRTRIEIDPFRPIPRAAARALEGAGERLAAFVAPHEPEVYARYRHWRSAGTSRQPR
jgi:hypothetical protein